MFSSLGHPVQRYCYKRFMTCDSMTFQNFPFNQQNALGFDLGRHWQVVKSVDISTTLLRHSYEYVRFSVGDHLFCPMDIVLSELLCINLKTLSSVTDR